MKGAAPLPPCFLVEWYRPGLTEEAVDDTAATLDRCAAALSAAGTPVQLLVTIAAPADEILFGVFAAGSAHTVAAVCQRAGIAAQRVTAAVGTRIRPVEHRETPDVSPSSTRIP